jgi:hypothetical protein
LIGFILSPSPLSVPPDGTEFEDGDLRCLVRIHERAKNARSAFSFAYVVEVDESGAAVKIDDQEGTRNSNAFDWVRRDSVKACLQKWRFKTAGRYSVRVSAGKPPALSPRESRDYEMIILPSPGNNTLVVHLSLIEANEPGKN